MTNRDSNGRFIKGHSLGKRFEKNNNPWNKDNGGYKLKSYNLSEEGRKIKVKNLFKNGIHPLKGKKLPKEWVAKIAKANMCKDWKRSKRIKKESYIMRTYMGKSYPEHHLIWLEQNDWNWNYIPKGFVIHHKNGIKDDNRIENLVCIPHGFHTTLHYQMNLNNNPNRKYWGINKMRGE